MQKICTQECDSTVFPSGSDGRDSHAPRGDQRAAVGPRRRAGVRVPGVRASRAAGPALHAHRLSGANVHHQDEGIWEEAASGGNRPPLGCPSHPD